MMTSSEFVGKAKLALSEKSLYVNGAWGAPASPYNKTRYCNSRNSWHLQDIKNASPDTFFFDCVCLIKAILWGWRADPDVRNGGAIYASNGVPDIGEDNMISMCSVGGTDFTSKDLVKGCVVWIPGHIGIYIGNGQVIECTSAWKCKVQLTACNNVPASKRYANLNRRTWARWGQLPWVDYRAEYGMTEAEVKKLMVNMFPALFAESMKEYNKNLAELPASSDYAKNALDWMKDKGYMSGGTDGNMMPRKPLTREEYAIVEYNEAKSDGRA